jgi:hypothetical protein
MGAPPSWPPQNEHPTDRSAGYASCPRGAGRGQLHATDGCSRAVAPGKAKAHSRDSLVSAVMRMADLLSGVQVVPFAALRGSTWTPFGPPSCFNGGGHGSKNDKGSVSGLVVLLVGVVVIGVLLAEHVGHRP